MTTDEATASDLMGGGDFNELINETARVIGHMGMLGRPSGVTTRLFETLASVAAMYIVTLYIYVYVSSSLNYIRTGL